MLTVLSNEFVVDLDEILCVVVNKDPEDIDDPEYISITFKDKEEHLFINRVAYHELLNILKKKE